ncbi:sprT-like domain-containing protein Spartan [Selaginella moellendorffii]|uniref:sprT-like domain-containing protein Spartan n=1 Tax=Selaginella moellendorffii TaxID=88036 RepID=UPI000D1CE67F|nr:sprT-like domain-containing protein Spartan [Selaginella moellendorffii]|eukprot:XP_024518540.1 sprT-like domain-containing protein Spartan [Selaginella moellendorffii]
MEVRHGDLLDPHPDITALFCYYNALYFQGKLGACSVQWSSKRMTLCAGICKYSFCGGCEIRLSEPLLKYRSVSDLKNTLLHEMIHAFLFLDNGNKDHDDHGQYFLAKMKEINVSSLQDFERPVEGYNITVYHNFKDEVNNYRVHHWTCQSCGNLVKRAMNRAPSPADCTFKAGSTGTCSHPRCLWHTHETTCGGSYLKTAEPPGYKDKRKKRKEEGSSIGSGENKAGKSHKTAGRVSGMPSKNLSIKDFLSVASGSKNTNAIDLTADDPMHCFVCPNPNAKRQSWET